VGRCVARVASRQLMMTSKGRVSEVGPAVNYSDPAAVAAPAECAGVLDGLPDGRFEGRPIVAA